MRTHGLATVTPENQIAFEIVAIQSMEESGNLLLEWSGSEHTH